MTENKFTVSISAEQPDAVVNIEINSTGKDGYTPKRGVDYWTEEDKQEIVDDVKQEIGELPGGGTVKSVNGKKPDKNGNVVVDPELPSAWDIPSADPLDPMPYDKVLGTEFGSDGEPKWVLQSPPSAEAVRYTAQTLNVNQQAQARKNIGAQPAGDYALKSEIPSVAVQSVNGKTGDVVLTADDVGAAKKEDVERLTEEIEELKKKENTLAEISGEIVSCFPKVPSELYVVSDLPYKADGYTTATLHVHGKNWLPVNGWTVTNGQSFVIDGDDMVATFTSSYKNISISMYVPAGKAITFAMDEVTDGALFQVRENDSKGTMVATISSTYGLTCTAPAKSVGRYLYCAMYSNSSLGAGTARYKKPRAMIQGENEFAQYTGNKYIADFGETVYGGSFDWKTGVLVSMYGSDGALLDAPVKKTIEKTYVQAINGENIVYAESGRVNVAYEESDKSVTALEAQKLETPKVVITDKLYAVAGHEFVLYYNNVLRCMCPENYVVSTVFNDDTSLLALNPQYDRMLKFTPAAEHVGTYSITIKVVDKRTWETVATKDSSIVISADTALDGKRVMFIGDSLTEASTYVAEIERMSNNGITSVGTIEKSITFNGGTATVKSEGRSGWASYDYLYNLKTNFENPFYNPDVEHSLELDKKYSLGDLGGVTLDNSGDKSVLKHHFDFAHYTETNPDVEVPDAVFINLGTNGGNGYALPYVYIAFDAMIERIRAFSDTLPIYLYLFPPVSQRVDGGRNMNGIRNVNIKYDARTSYYDCIETLIDRYKDDDRIIIVPTYTMLDTLYDYKTVTVNVSARNEETITIGHADRTHPAKSGYLHMADSFYNILQALWN